LTNYRVQCDNYIPCTAESWLQTICTSYVQQDDELAISFTAAAAAAAADANSPVSVTQHPRKQRPTRQPNNSSHATWWIGRDRNTACNLTAVCFRLDLIKSYSSALTFTYELKQLQTMTAG
jgi:hypothetical protein